MVEERAGQVMGTTWLGGAGSALTSSWNHTWCGVDSCPLLADMALRLLLQQNTTLADTLPSTTQHLFHACESPVSPY